jgi:hypothetical protein
MYGTSIFGDPTPIPDSAASTPVGSRVPVGGTWPLTGSAGTRIPVTGSRGTRSVIGTVMTPPGALVPAGQVSAVTTTRGTLLPVQITRGLRAPIGRMRDPIPGMMPAAEQAFWNRWLAKFYPGIFHQPPLTGGHRYAPWHPFGPPSLEGYRGFGSPDGLGLFGYR